jgi:hypothetical protein
LLLCAKRLFVERNREEHVFHRHVLLESLSLDDSAQVGAVQLIKSAADKTLELNKSVAVNSPPHPAN